MRRNKQKKGLTQTIEIMLLLFSVVVLAVFAVMGQGRMIIQQATSAKATVITQEARVEPIDPTSTQVSYNPYVQVSFSISNIGNEPVYIRQLILPTTDTQCIYTATIYQQLNPGEMISLSYLLQRTASGTADCSTSTGQITNPAPLIIKYQDQQNRELTVSTDAILVTG